ncbi:MAG: hypothetical protein IKA47_08275 [Oscillospiraceae bacterium]|nr:hypothetical protein [Oscillospiraceae bacterium]
MTKKFPNHEQSLIALLENPTISAAAKACGLSEATLYRRLSDPVFKAEYTARRRQILEAACGSLQGRIGEAVEALSEIMNDGEAPKAARVQASRAILEYGIKTVETLDILPRLEALENRRDGM